MIKRYSWLASIVVFWCIPNACFAEPTAINIENVKHWYSAPYLLDFTFSLRDQDGHAIVTNASALTAVCQEDGDPIGGETEYRILAGQNKQLQCFLVLDYTFSMANPVVNGDSDGDGISDAIETMESAAKTFVDTLNQDAQIGLYEFHREDDGHPPAKVRDLTLDKAQLKGAIDSIWTDYVQWFPAGTRVWDAVYAAVGEFPADNPGDAQRFVIFLSDGADESSDRTPAEIISLAGDRGVRVYAIGFGSELNSNALINVTSQCDGQYYTAGNVAALQSTFEQITHDLQGQYVLRWATLKESGSFAPSFQLQLGGLSDTHTASSAYYPGNHSGDKTEGRLRFQPFWNPDTKVATVILAADYMPRYITRMRVGFRTAFPVDVEMISPQDGGVCPATWSLTSPDRYDGGGWIEVSSPRPQNIFSGLPFAVVGKVLRLRFHGVSRLEDCLLGVEFDNSVYPGGQTLVLQNVDSIRSDSPTLSMGTPYSWLQRHSLTNDLVNVEQADPDGDGCPTWHEYQSDTDPTNRMSHFRLVEVGRTDSKLDGTVTFGTATGWTYTVEWVGGLGAPWQASVTNIQGTGRTVTISNAVPTNRSILFCRAVGAPPPPPPGMVWAAAGTAAGGSPTVSEGFWIDKYEVTNEQMVEVLQWAYDQGGLITASASTVRNATGSQQELLDLDSSWSQISFSGGTFAVDGGKDRYPCVEVSWYGAAAYCNYLSRKSGRTEAYDLSDWSVVSGSDGYRLPSEAQWEYAARGGKNGADTEYSGSDTIGDVAWYSSNSGGRSHEVGTVGPNAANELGTYDMSGNVWEWCYDWHPDHVGSYRVDRGGSWYFSATYCRVAIRNGNTPGHSNNNLGFRAVLPAGQE